MAPTLGVNLRVTGHCNQGGRKYMEDVFSVAYQQTEDEKDLEYAYFGIFDGHGGREAALYAKVSADFINYYTNTYDTLFERCTTSIVHFLRLTWWMPLRQIETFGLTTTKWF